MFVIQHTEERFFYENDTTDSKECDQKWYVFTTETSEYLLTYVLVNKNESDLFFLCFLGAFIHEL